MEGNILRLQGLKLDNISNISAKRDLKAADTSGHFNVKALLDLFRDPKARTAQFVTKLGFEKLDKLVVERLALDRPLEAVAVWCFRSVL